MFTKELYKITCTRNGETSDIGTYLLKPGPEAPMDCYRNFLNKTNVAVPLKAYRTDSSLRMIPNPTPAII